MSQTHLVLILTWTSLCAGQNYEVNVALNKNCNQSSTLDNWFAEKAVDNKLYEENYGNCMHTDYLDYDPWWAVDLGQIYPVLNLKLYTRGKMFSRVVNSTITVDEQFCTKIYPLPSTNPLDLRCKYLIYGQRINITRDRYGDYYLSFCEFQVLVPNDVSVCDIGKFGSSCQDTCSTACGQGQGKNACQRNGGKCYGCIDGKAGDTCSEACTSSHCLNNKCYQDNGTCIDCTDYVLSPNCTECKPGFYGENCNIACKSKICLNNSCDRNSGECLQCQRNLKPPSCMECNDGYRGTGCDIRCDTRCYLKCNRTTGYCSQCYPGWQGNFCRTECNTGFYGVDCNASCGQCLTPSTCNHTNGHCSSCNSGYVPPLCQEECLDGTYGIDCKNACGQCADGTACDKRLGTCHKCVPGKMLPYCIQGHVSSDVYIIAGAIIGGFLILAASISATIICLRWIKNKSVECKRPNIELQTSFSHAGPLQAQADLPKSMGTGMDYENVGNPYDSLDMNALDDKARYSLAVFTNVIASSVNDTSLCVSDKLHNKTASSKEDTPNIYGDETYYNDPNRK